MPHSGASLAVYPGRRLLEPPAETRAGRGRRVPEGGRLMSGRSFLRRGFGAVVRLCPRSGAGA